MSELLDEIRRINKEAACELKSAGFETESDIRSLDRQDLLELLPGKDKLRVRKEIYKLICRSPHQSPKYETIFKDLKELVQSDLLAGELTDKKTLLEFVSKMKAFSEALIDLLETNNANPPDKPNNVVYNANSVSAICSTRDAPAASSADSKNSSFSLFSPFSWRMYKVSSPETQATPSSTTASNFAVNIRCSAIQPYTKATVIYKMVVSGKTLEKHFDVVERLNGPVPGRSVSLQLKESQCHEDSQVTIVFCPIVSRTGTDVNSALQDISSDKPVIVVAMYHLHTPTSIPAPRTDSRVQLGVNVFFHETVGLLNCSQNDEAINEIKTKLLEYSTKKSCVNPQ